MNGKITIDIKDLGVRTSIGVHSALDAPTLEPTEKYKIISTLMSAFKVTSEEYMFMDMLFSNILKQSSIQFRGDEARARHQFED